MKYLDEIGLTPSRSLCPCPACGGDHRWALLKHLLMHALDVRLGRNSKLLTLVDISLEPVRKLYGGEEGLHAVMGGAEEFFAKVDAKFDGKK